MGRPAPNGRRTRSPISPVWPLPKPCVVKGSFAGARIKEIIEEAKAKVDDAVDKLNVDRARTRTKEILDEAKAKTDEAVDTLKSRLRSDD